MGERAALVRHLHLVEQLASQVPAHASSFGIDQGCLIWLLYVASADERGYSLRIESFDAPKPYVAHAPCYEQPQVGEDGKRVHKTISIPGHRRARGITYLPGRFASYANTTSGLVTNMHGWVVPMIHQYDRCPELRAQQLQQQEQLNLKLQKRRYKESEEARMLARMNGH